MKLVDLDAGFVSSSPGTSTGLQFLCPGCKRERIVVPFSPTIGPGPVDASLNARGVVWQRSGDTVETITLTPSIDSKHVNFNDDPPHHPVECHWHGWVRDGAVVPA